MIIEVRAKTVMHLRDDITFSMKADMRNKNLEQMFTKRIILMSLKR